MANSNVRGGALILHLRYRVDIWVEVDTATDDVVDVVVDEASMARPHAVLASGGAFVPPAARETAERIALGSDWPTWDYGQPPA